MQTPTNIFQAIFNQLLPTACIVCQKFQDLRICHDCTNVLQQNALLNYQCCYQCGVALNSKEIAHQQCVLCQKSHLYVDKTFCLDRYDGVLQSALHALKYQKRIANASALSHAWNSLFMMQLGGISADYLLPVPLSTQKLAERGFNQSWEIAKHIRCHARIKKTPYVLQRHHQIEHQAGRTLEHRRSAIRGMFYIDQIYTEYLQNATVIVFDDVMTSGATLNEIARVLKDNGASLVINWVLLRAPRPI